MNEDRQRLTPHMMRTDLRAQAVLQRAGEEVVHTWFPCGSATAAFRVWIDETNPAVEVALVGSSRFRDAPRSSEWALFTDQDLRS
jgi:hypothetical protein